MDPEAILALLNVLNQPRCVLHADCPPEATDAAQAPTTPRLPAQSVTQVNIAATSSEGYSLSYPIKYGR